MRKKGKHTSVDRELKQAIRWLESFPYISRVIIGRAEPARHAFPPGTIRVQMNALGGLHLKGYGGRGVQNIYIKVDSEFVEIVKTKIEERFPC